MAIVGDHLPLVESLKLFCLKIFISEESFKSKLMRRILQNMVSFLLADFDWVSQVGICKLGSLKLKV